MLVLTPAFVVSHDSARLAQFREAWRAVGLPDCVRKWRACVCPSAPSLGNAVAQYALARHALASGLDSLLVFEDDAIPREDAAALLHGYLADAAARAVHALRLGWIPLPSDEPPPDGRAVLGSHAYALLSREAIEDYCAAWPDLAKADAVFVPMRGPVECAPQNLFAQFIPASAASHGIHGARGRFNADPRLQKIRASYAAAFSRAFPTTPNHPTTKNGNAKAQGRLHDHRDRHHTPDRLRPDRTRRKRRDDAHRRVRRQALHEGPERDLRAQGRRHHCALRGRAARAPRERRDLRHHHARLFRRVRRSDDSAVHVRRDAHRHRLSGGRVHAHSDRRHRSRPPDIEPVEHLAGPRPPGARVLSGSAFGKSRATGSYRAPGGPFLTAPTRHSSLVTRHSSLPMSPTVATITVLGAKLAVKALTYGLARRFRRASPDERVEILGEAWPQLVEPVDPATPLPPVDDVPLCVLNRVADLAANPDPDFLSEPQSGSGSAGSVC